MNVPWATNWVSTALCVVTQKNGELKNMSKNIFQNNIPIKEYYFKLI